MLSSVVILDCVPGRVTAQTHNHELTGARRQRFSPAGAKRLAAQYPPISPLHTTAGSTSANMEAGVITQSGDRHHRGGPPP
jgi:hypothetical protein